MSARHRLVQDYLRTDKAESPRRELMPVSDADANADIAWLDNQDQLTTLSAPSPTQAFSACACCSGALVLSTHLSRLLRRGHWRGLVITLGARSEPRKLLAQMQAEPWCDVLGPVRLISLMDETGLSLCDSPQHPLQEIALQQRDLAHHIVKPGEILREPWFGVI